MFATATALTICYVVLAALLVMVPPIITLLKGQRLLFIVGLVTLGPVWIIVAMRLARPTSFWAERFYGPAKQGRARLRYPE